MTVRVDAPEKRRGILHSKPTMFFLKTTSAPAGDVREESSFDSESSLPFTALAVKDVIYKGEGNANIVVTLPHERTVIRFRKSLPDEVSPDSSKIRVQREVGYTRNVVSYFLGSYLQIPEIVRYDAADIAKLSDAVHPLRPAASVVNGNPPSRRPIATPHAGGRGGGGIPPQCPPACGALAPGQSGEDLPHRRRAPPR
ncbi:PREDICTED: uncharacterized protein LOC108776749 [Cyphomyrmex costatus]|uniref:uncharacterized protein LOC108776749 n=1 Tax=Cyphomyrmex costatus TaxID=456900 RepID=UPI0008522185|nr:PREDICTED: uncharacterized protein LOC108776749 [Cyphomyrmex costatus]